MTAATLDKQIQDYLSKLNPRENKAVLTVVKAFADEQESLLDTPSFAEEMDRRIEELENGRVKGHTWEEVKESSRASINKKK